MWHCTFAPSASREHFVGIYNDGFTDGSIAPLNITKFSVKGCYFDRLVYINKLGSVDFSRWNSNHYAHAEPGTISTYSSGGFWRLAQALTALWRRHLKNVMDENIFSRIGITADQWD